jgi:hypothetical protein
MSTVPPTIFPRLFHSQPFRRQMLPLRSSEMERCRDEPAKITRYRNRPAHCGLVHSRRINKVAAARRWQAYVAAERNGIGQAHCEGRAVVCAGGFRLRKQPMFRTWKVCLSNSRRQGWPLTGIATKRPILKQVLIMVEAMTDKPFWYRIDHDAGNPYLA